MTSRETDSLTEKRFRPCGDHTWNRLDSPALRHMLSAVRQPAMQD